MPDDTNPDQEPQEPQEPQNGGGAGAGQTGDDATARQLRQARAEARDWRLKHKTAAERVAELEGASKTELERASERATAAEQARQDAEARALRLEVAHERGLPASLARRLQGSTREEIEQDAEDLAKTLGNGATGGSGRRPTNAGQHAGGAAPGKSPNDWLREKLTARG